MKTFTYTNTSGDKIEITIDAFGLTRKNTKTGKIVEYIGGTEDYKEAKAKELISIDR